ncbi:MAG: helix-turn-helix domain-containing protein [Burkholderiaceae bacterium]|jgi:transcriptional regulator with XRE-family HTH domain|nr:helix-turn-helix domain-containing protein [Burkholderiaceae bacterium]
MSKEIGKRINSLRLQAGQTPEQYARLIGVSRQALLKWERGETANIKIHNLVRLAECHDMTLDALITGKTVGTETKTGDFWPFTVSRQAFLRLPNKRKKAIDEYIRMVVNDASCSNNGGWQGSE